MKSYGVVTRETRTFIFASETKLKSQLFTWFCRSAYFLFLTSSDSWLHLQTIIVKMYSFRRSWQRRYTSSEDEHRHSSVSLFSRISISPLKEIICPQIWQNLNFALLVLTSFRRRGQVARLYSRCFKRAGNNSKEKLKKQENRMHIPAVELHVVSTGITASFKSMKEHNWTHLPIFSACLKY